MKIGLLTQPLGHNYGGILQAYALKTVLERRGHRVVLFDWYSRLEHPWRELINICKRTILKYVVGKDIPVFYELSKKIACRRLLKFVDDRFDKRYVRRWGPKCVSGLDAVVVGSDQVWRPEYNRGTLIGHNFLDFCQDDDIRRVAYAASFGTDKCEFTDDQIKAFSPLLQKFDGVSVREDSGVRLCRELFGVEALHLPDPTLLLDKSDYMALAGIAPADKPRGGLLAYILDETEDTRHLIGRISTERSLKAFRCNTQYENRKAPLRERIQPPLEDWLRAFYDADFVVADSFHAAVFSLIFAKPFVIIGNEGRGLARFDSLLNKFQCRGNMILSPSEYDPSRSYLPSQESFRRILAAERLKAFAFIDKSLPTKESRLAATLQREENSIRANSDSSLTTCCGSES